MSATYESLEDKKVCVSSILRFHINIVLKGIYRKLTFKQKYKHPWYFEVKESIPADIFYHWYKVVDDFQTTFGRECSIIKTKNNKKIKSYEIKFINFGSLKYHLKLLLGNEKFLSSFKKVNRKEGCVIKLLATEEKPVTFKYLLSSNSVIVTGSYEVVNRYGNVCSF